MREFASSLDDAACRRTQLRKALEWPSLTKSKMLKSLTIHNVGVVRLSKVNSIQNLRVTAIQLLSTAMWFEPEIIWRIWPQYPSASDFRPNFVKLAPFSLQSKHIDVLPIFCAVIIIPSIACDMVALIAARLTLIFIYAQCCDFHNASQWTLPLYSSLRWEIVRQKVSYIIGSPLLSSASHHSSKSSSAVGFSSVLSVQTNSIAESILRKVQPSSSSLKYRWALPFPLARLLQIAHIIRPFDNQLFKRNVSSSQRTAHVSDSLRAVFRQTPSSFF